MRYDDFIKNTTETTEENFLNLREFERSIEEIPLVDGGEHVATAYRYSAVGGGADLFMLDDGTNRLYAISKTGTGDIGIRVGAAIAHDVLANPEMDRKWTGLDPQDGDQFLAAGLDPDTVEWEAAERDARAEYLRMIEQG